MRGLLLGLLKSWTRMTSFIGKEITEVVRRPGVLVSLVLGPFLIMALFGVGYSGQRRPLETSIVLPGGSTLPQDPAFYQEVSGQSVHIVEVTGDLASARERLQQGVVDLLVIAPEDVEQAFLDGRQATIGVEYNQIDPIRDNYAQFVAQRQVQELNRRIIARAVGEGKSYLVASAGSDPSAQIPAEVVAAPMRADLRNWAPISPTVVAYFAPAVLALVLQHMAVTLTALSLVRERLSGVFDVFRVAPVRSFEILAGKYLAYAFFNLAIATAVSLLMVFGLGVPLLGEPRFFALVVGLLTFASLGLGLLISTLADSELQAVQLSMLVLLASVFFSGFVLPLEEFQPFARAFAYALPVTHGIQLMQDIMLRGGTYNTWELWALGVIGTVLFLATGLTLRRSLSSG